MFCQPRLGNGRETVDLQPQNRGGTFIMTADNAAKANHRQELMERDVPVVLSLPTSLGSMRLGRNP
jgi:hypothetical protein